MLRAGDLVAKPLVLQGELVDDADQGRHIAAEPLEIRVLRGDRLLQLGDLGPQAGFCVGDGATLPDVVVELVAQVGVPLGQRVAGNSGESSGTQLSV
ncbi:hypothetical protein [Kitasatospora sp. NPDC058190]|uniref:hypothetical protein n=1 Tax=Kitasatospora sp. NPDC058190 TaxID=3346371 RepID=UPI0036DA7923